MKTVNKNDNLDQLLKNVRPEHYNRLVGQKLISAEPKDVIRAWGLNFNLGNVIKYVSRAGYKDNIIQDLEKAKQYLQFEIDALRKDSEEKEYQNEEYE